MTTRHAAHPVRRPSRRASTARRSALSGGLVPVLLLGLLLGTATPAAAVPLGWSDPDPVSGLHVLLLLVVAPLGLLLLITLLTALPSLLSGERVSATGGGDQWFGGPVRGTKELSGPDTEDSQAGGAGVRW